jgi:hypothetical protein
MTALRFAAITVGVWLAVSVAAALVTIPYEAATHNLTPQWVGEVVGVGGFVLGLVIAARAHAKRKAAKA